MVVYRLWSPDANLRRLGDPEGRSPERMRRCVKESQLVCLQAGVDVRLLRGEGSPLIGEQRDRNRSPRILVEGLE